MKTIKAILLLAVLALSVTSIASADNVTVDSVDDVDHEGLRVGVQSGTTSDLYAQENFDHATISAYDTILLAEEALETGDVEVLMGDNPVLEAWAADKSEYAVLATFSEELFGLGVKEGEATLLSALNAALTEIFQDNSSTGYDAIYAEHFDDIPAVYDDGDGNYAYPAAGDLAGVMKHIYDTGEILFGTDPTYPPFEEKTTEGTYEGFDIDMMDAIAARLSTEYNKTISVAIYDSDWDPIITNLQNGEFDVILSAMTKTAERDQQIDFTRAYYGSIQAVLGPADGKLDFDHTHETEGFLPLEFLSFLTGFIALGIVLRRRN